MNKKYQWIAYLLMALIIQSCNQNNANKENAANTPTESTVDAEQYQTIPGLNHGLLQSPINIISNETEHGEHQIIMQFNDEINKIENKGHTIQLDFVPGSTISKDGISYEFKQIHFHTPSEHHIDGIEYPMEMHVVNTLVDSANNKAETYLVLAMLFKMGAENQFIKEFVAKIPEFVDAAEDVEQGTVHLADLIGPSKDNLHDCYHYKGSLTTPPFTESVNWFIAKKIFEASNEQIQRINKVEGDNARHVQAKYGRIISEE
jgi:carbonic anhydrase